MQQIPANALPEERQNDYRNCFTPGRAGWSIVGADYSSQELAIVATLSQDPVFLEALEKGFDLHSVCSELVYEDKWKNAAEDTCVYYKLDENGVQLKQKCKCKLHKSQRTDIKTTNFGIIYGLSAKGLAADLNISLEEATTLFTVYFGKFPKVKGTLDNFGNFGKLNGFIRTTAPWRRKRYFPYWRGADTPKNMLAQIERASFNAPFQGLAADMTKLAMIEFRRWINKEGYRDVIQPFMQVHDQIDVNCEDSYVPLVEKQLKFIMEKAAEICLQNTLLKTELQTTKLWQK